MSGRLVGEVVDWLQTPAADGLTPAEAVILLVIAERAHDKTRDMWRHRIDDHSLYERIKRAARRRRPDHQGRAARRARAAARPTVQRRVGRVAGGRELRDRPPVRGRIEKGPRRPPGAA